MLKQRFVFLSLIIFSFNPRPAFSQFSEKVVFNNKDSANDYYLAVRPLSGNIQGVQVLITSFNPPEFVLAESKLQNIAYGNDILTIIASLGPSLCADSSSVERLNQILQHVVTHYSADTSRFVLGGFIYAGNTALRYTELCYENPSRFPVLPKAVFAINSPVDLVGLARWCEAEIKKDYYSGDVGDGKYILDALTKKYGTYTENVEKYIQLSPFYSDAQTLGNEQFLKHVAVRLYFDTDITWQLQNRRNSYYDTYMPDGSEMVKRMLLAGNSEAEFVSSKQPGIRSTGLRSPYSWSIVDEVDCIQWIKQKLKIFNPQTYSPKYLLPVPKGWQTEQFALPPDFAKQITMKGVEDLRFSPGWGDPNSEEHWSYAFLWSLDGKVDMNASVLRDNLTILYTGLVGRNIVPRKIPKEKLFPVEVNIQIVKTAAGDIKTFAGTVHMLDYINQMPMTLNLRIHVKDCPDKTHSILLFEVSPKSPDHANWLKLDQLNSDFNCVR
jgi:hypothetical protein